MHMSNLLTFYDRERIEYYLHFKRLSLRKIAGFIGRNHTVVIREVKRNKPQFFPYNAELAQKAADRRSHYTNKRKLDKDESLKDYVRARLRDDDWSPQQIAGRLKKHPPPELNKQSVCMETIYQYIYCQADGEERWFPCLKRAKRQRQRRYNRKPQKVSIPDRVSIQQREETINSKLRYGDWESDTLSFSRQKPALSVQYERKAMLVKIHKLTDKGAEETKEAITKTLDDFPGYFNKSMTFDNGGEGAKHQELKEVFNIQTYFCDPYKSWQKGGVENINGLLRRYLPRRTNLVKIENEQILIIQELLNNRPRKTLNYLTPNEVINKELNIKSGALNYRT